MLAEMNDLFSVPVAQSNLNIDIKQMADECLKYSLVNSSLSKSNIGGYQSNDISKINSSVFKEFYEQLKKEVSRFENHTQCPKTSGSYTWININGKKDYNVAHAHPKGIISGVFYVKVPENSGKIILQHPGLQVLESYWSPYYDELYNPDTRQVNIKIYLTPADIANFEFYYIIRIKNREYRVNKIEYKPYELSSVELILIA